MHYTALEVQPPAHDAPPPRGRLIIISHAFTTIFATAWEFALPLALLAAYSQQGKDSLTAPAALTLAQTTTSMFLGPATGRWADKTERQRAMRLARCVQIAGTALSVAGARLLTSETYFNAHAGKILAAVLFGAVLETLGSLVTKAAPKKDWVPTLFGGDAYVDAQSRVTFYISNVSQVAGIVGPFLGSAALTWSVRDGAAVVGIAAIAAELPAQMLLEMLYAASPALQRAKQVDKLDAGGSAVSRGAWRAWLAQPSGSTFLTTSFALLFFTVLAPHGAVLTAYLAAMHVQPFAISLFRAFGAGAGLVGISLFSKLATVTIAISSRFDADVPGSASAARVTALRKASGVALIGQTCAVALATGALYLRHLFGHALFLFMVAVVFSRAGLYAYDVRLYPPRVFVSTRMRRSGTSSFSKSSSTNPTGQLAAVSNPRSAVRPNWPLQSLPSLPTPSRHNFSTLPFPRRRASSSLSWFFPFGRNCIMSSSTITRRAARYIRTQHNWLAVSAVKTVANTSTYITLVPVCAAKRPMILRQRR